MQAITGFKMVETLCNIHLQTGCKRFLNPYNERVVGKAYGEWLFGPKLSIANHFWRIYCLEVEIWGEPLLSEDGHRQHWNVINEVVIVKGVFIVISSRELHKNVR